MGPTMNLGGINLFHKQRKNEGFSLIEVLIAIVVGALGLLGLAAILSLSVKHTKSSVYRTTATILASQLADSIRVNRNAMGAYVTSNSNFSEISAGETELDDTISLTETNCYGSTKDCSPADIANYDMYLWWLHAKTMLPDPKATIALDAADADRILITMSWTEQTNKEASDTDGAGKQTGFKRVFHTLEVKP